MRAPWEVPLGGLGTHRGAAELRHLQGTSRVSGLMMSCAWQCLHNLCDVSAVELDAGNVQVNSVIRELTVVLLGLHTHCSGVIGRGPLQVCLHRQSWAWLPAAVTVWVWSPGHEQELQLMHLDKQAQDSASGPGEHQGHAQWMQLLRAGNWEEVRAWNCSLNSRAGASDRWLLQSQSR